MCFGELSKIGTCCQFGVNGFQQFRCSGLGLRFLFISCTVRKLFQDMARFDSFWCGKRRLIRLVIIFNL